MQVFQVIIADVFSPAKTFPDLGSLINVIVKNIFVFAGVLLFVLLIFGGVKFIIGTETQDQGGIEKGKNAITAAILGFVLIFCAYWIVQIIEYLTGVKIFKPEI